MPTTSRRASRPPSRRKRALRAFLRRHRAECAFLRRWRVRAVTIDRGFTLLEVMIVLAIIGLIAAAIGTNVMGSLRDGRLRATKVQVREVVGAAQQAMLDDTSCPTLDELVTRQVLRKPPKDAWGTPLELRCPAEHDKDPVDVISAGPDKKPGTEDDIRSWEL